MKLARVAKAVAVAFVILYATGAGSEEPTNLQFVSEYVREISEIERLRQRAEYELKNSHDVISDCIRNMTSLHLELKSQVQTMSSIKLNGPFEDLPKNIVSFYIEKINIYRDFSDHCSILAEGPKSGVDYGKISSELPKLSARLDYVDHALFEASPLIFSTLIDDRADSKGHVSHLIITKAEREKLLRQIDQGFGEKVDRKGDLGYIVASASVLKGYLLKDFKASDEAW